MVQFTFMGLNKMARFHSKGYIDSDGNKGRRLVAFTASEETAMDAKVKAHDVKFPDTLAERRKNKIKRLKDKARVKLANTDWYIVRNQENNTTIPHAILDERAAIRADVVTKENQINSMTDDVLMRDIR